MKAMALYQCDMQGIWDQQTFFPTTSKLKEISLKNLETKEDKNSKMKQICVKIQ